MYGGGILLVGSCTDTTFYIHCVQPCSNMCTSKATCIVIVILWFWTHHSFLQVQIEAVFMVDLPGDISIDDVDIEMVPCSQLTTAQPIPSTTPTPGTWSPVSLFHWGRWGGGGGGVVDLFYTCASKNLGHQIQYLCMGIWDPTIEMYKYCDKQNKREKKVQYWKKIMPKFCPYFPWTLPKCCPC